MPLAPGGSPALLVSLLVRDIRPRRMVRSWPRVSTQDPVTTGLPALSAEPAVSSRHRRRLHLLSRGDPIIPPSDRRLGWAPGEKTMARRDCRSLQPICVSASAYNRGRTCFGISRTHSERSAMVTHSVSRNACGLCAGMHRGHEQALASNCVNMQTLLILSSEQVQSECIFPQGTTGYAKTRQHIQLSPAAERL
jgi:hypothetical protein